MRTIYWSITLPFRLIRRFWSLLAVTVLVASLAFNMALLTMTGVYTAASSALSALGVTTVAAREAAERAGRKKATRRIAREAAEKVTRRMQRGAARNIASAAGEAIPVAGVAVIAGALALEVKDACDTAADMAGLEAALAADGNADAARQAAIESFDCVAMIREELPGYEDLPAAADIWESVRTAPAAAFEAARNAGVQVAGVDWTGQLAGTLDYILGWAGGFGDAFGSEGASQ
ncbi:hypothetical protein ACUXV3_11775 [Roseobacteraceae bacterium NS-SX3]